MSLLLEALKKAEKAKEEAQRKARGDSGAETASRPELRPELRLEGEVPPAAAAPAAVPSEPVLTRDQLPDIHQPLEIEQDPPAPKKAEAPAEPPPRARPKAEPKAEPQAAERAAARKVFQAKFKEPNPRLPFFITVGALGVFALGTVVYFWIQLRPAPALVNTNPPRPAAEVQVAGTDARPAAAPSAAAPQSSSSAIPGLPGGASAPAPVAKAAPAPKPAPAIAKPAPSAQQPIARPQERPVLKPIPKPAPAAPAQPEVTAVRGGPQVHPKVSTAYAAYTSGDLATARADYQQALRDEPANRDALLGLAAVDVRVGRYEAAEAAYVRLLQADPRDAHAQAALISLRGRRVDPLSAESRMKSMLADNPGAHVLNFALGNQLAQQGRWAEAQAEYFKAFSAEPDNADFAYNLAVALDHLRQPKLALEYYRRALALANARGAGFDLAAAQARVAQLGR